MPWGTDFSAPVTHVLGLAYDRVCAGHCTDQASAADNDPDVCNTQYRQHKEGHAHEHASTKATVHFMNRYSSGISGISAPPGLVRKYEKRK